MQNQSTRDIGEDLKVVVDFQADFESPDPSVGFRGEVEIIVHSVRLKDKPHIDILNKLNSIDLHELEQMCAEEVM